ncbi:colorectal mutant cancer protein isoform X1 [Onthophagus taurus]|uniref:colorectal mutant cancer protein isoform X1 n=1 Tax=Onthophagus taurus TaxID=166361 RepID=UPI0039BE32BA
MADTDCASESASSVCDEERVRRLFQACDANGDGYIDSQDLLSICRELSLEDSLDELMLQLGADSQGRISYEQFLQRRLALRPEIDALKHSKHTDNTSENSQGKLDSWEWDSGARDMSPIPKSLEKKSLKLSEDTFKEKLQEQLDEQSQRYEEQLTELHSVIAELTRKLQQQKAMAIAEEDEISEPCTDLHEDSLTCPLEVSELEPAENDLSDVDVKPFAESPSELPEPKLSTSNHENNETTSPNSTSQDSVTPLKQEIASLKAQLLEAHAKLSAYETTTRSTTPTKDVEDATTKTLESVESQLETDCEQPPKNFYNKNENLIKYGNIVPVHKSHGLTNRNGIGIPRATITKMAERIKLKTVSDDLKDFSSNEVTINGEELSTIVAEHIVGDILRQCDSQSEKQAVEIEFKRLTAKLEHARSQNSVLALTLSETKAHCDRLALLCGKYESNAIALRLALGMCDRAIEAYDVLLALLETELSLNENNVFIHSKCLDNRTAAETVAKQLLTHLDSYQSTDVLLSPWQNHINNTPTIENDESWTTDHENRLREHVSRLKAERSNIQGTYVVLESTQVDHVPIRPSSSQEARKLDLEMAVLMQELMGLREEKAELVAKLFVMEKEKCTIELKLKYVEGQQKAQSATLKNIQGQLKDTEALLAIATQNKERGYSDTEHAQGVELELMQALGRESRLKVRLQELVSTLEQVTKNAEARLLEGRELVHDLNQTNSILAETVDRNNKKYQAKFKRMEQQMLQMVERHTSQIQTLQQRIASLETPPTNSSENSMSSVAV